MLVARSLQEKKERDAAFQKQLAFVRLEREDSNLLRLLLRFDRLTYPNDIIDFLFQLLDRHVTWYRVFLIGGLIPSMAKQTVLKDLLDGS